MADWPSDLPQSLNVRGFSESGPDGHVRTEMDAGPAHVRSRYTAVPDQIQGSMLLTKTQLLTVRTFYFATLANGSQPFGWTHPITGEPASMRLMSRPAPVPHSSDLWEVSLSLEVLP